MNATLRICIGLDVSKATLDACLLRAQGKPLHKQFANTPAGWAKLLRWAQSLAAGARLHFCLEATGAYSTGVASFLAEAEQIVSVENPARVQAFGVGLGLLNKTDKSDALAIATYCQKREPAPWRLSLPQVRLLMALLRRLEALSPHRVQALNRLGEPGWPKEVQRSLKKSLAFLDKESAALKAQIQQHMDRHPDLKADRQLLLSIPGIGETLAAIILAELPAVDSFASAQSAAAYAGLSPQQKRSGTSVKARTHLTKAGNAHLRRALYMPALSAIRFNPLVRAH
jgi:transposase